MVTDDDSYDRKAFYKVKIVFIHLLQGFPNGVDMWGIIWIKWPKTA